MRCRPFLALLVLGGCDIRCDDGPRLKEPLAPEARLQQARPIAWTLEVENSTGLDFRGPPGTLEASGSGGTVRWIGSRERGAGPHYVAIELNLHRLARGRAPVDLTSSRCTIRWLQEGRETEADYGVKSATVDVLSGESPWTGALRVECEKIVKERQDGGTYAAGAPQGFVLRGTAWAR